MSEDPRRRGGAFSHLLYDLRACKDRKTCPELTTRALYFEPNPETADAWAKQSLFTGPIDRRVMFVCESPSMWTGRGESSEPAQCFAATKRDKRFQDVRDKFGFADCYITNSVKCGPRRGKVHTDEEIGACGGFLIREVRLIQPLVIVGVGGASTYALSRRILPLMESPPRLFSITHYSARGSLEELRAVWALEFQGLVALLRDLGSPGG